MIEGIEEVGNSDSKSDFVIDGGKEETSGRGNTGGGREQFMNVVLLIMVFTLLGLFGYLFFTDRLVVGVANPFSKSEIDVENESAGQNDENFIQDDSDINDIEEEVKPEGKFQVKMGYPSEFLPSYRVCFSNISDISEVYCFVGNGSEGEAINYSNSLDEGIGSLPVGEYTMEYKMLMDVDYYIWNPCVKALNGYNNDQSVCQKFYNKLETAYKADDWGNYKMSYVNSYGGDAIIIKIEADKTTEIGNVALYPYFQITFMD